MKRRLYPFSILERIVVVETGLPERIPPDVEILSVSSNGSWWLKHKETRNESVSDQLSVSSNGSWWLKHDVGKYTHTLYTLSFSILERIVVVETDDLKGVLAPISGFQYPRTDRGG